MHLRLPMPGPFWYEDLFYAVIDGARRLPAHLSRGAQFAADGWTRRREIATGLKHAVTTLRRRQTPAKASREIRPEPDLLMDPVEWSLATAPLMKGDACAEAAVRYHHAALEQLDATTYALDRLHEELRPLMQSYPLARHAVEKLPEPLSIEEQLKALRAFADVGKQTKKSAKDKKRKSRSAA
jgi:uncharacterized protein with PIN domain